MRLDKSNSWGARIMKKHWNPDSKFGQGFRTIWSRFFYLAFYSVRLWLPLSLLPCGISRNHDTDQQGNQLRRDLNLIVGTGKNWRIPVFMPVLLRYISGPVLAIILSFAVPEFHSLRYDPLMVLGFIASILAIVGILLGFAVPRSAPAHNDLV
jgi:hypothetical protein